MEDIKRYKNYEFPVDPNKTWVDYTDHKAVVETLDKMIDAKDDNIFSLEELHLDDLKRIASMQNKIEELTKQLRFKSKNCFTCKDFEKDSDVEPCLSCDEFSRWIAKGIN